MGELPGQSLTLAARRAVLRHRETRGQVGSNDAQCR